ncbi:MAG: multicopper oxidase family protein, partial [Dermabacter sp.]|nr:multicopper oxidase family protein [Dermabacter sp.]
MTNAFSRRQVLLGGLVLAGTGTVTACTSDPGPAASAPGPSLRPTPTPTALGEPTVRRTLTARPLSLDIGGIEA